MVQANEWVKYRRIKQLYGIFYRHWYSQKRPETGVNLTFNQEVVGSIPAAPTKQFRTCFFTHRDRHPSGLVALGVRQIVAGVRPSQFQENSRAQFQENLCRDRVGVTNRRQQLKS